LLVKQVAQVLFIFPSSTKASGGYWCVHEIHFFIMKKKANI
ncbi:13234_t:CDS:1, partial [Dentiscutata heterogama]